MISGRGTGSAPSKTGRWDRENEVEEMEGANEAKEGPQLRPDGVDGETKINSMLKSAREERDHSPCKVLDRRSSAAGRQIHFASLRNAGSAGRRHERTAAFFRGGRLPQHSGVHERAGRGSENRQGYRSNHRTRAAGFEKQLAGAGCRQFRDDDAAAGGNSGRAGIYLEVDGRRLSAETADEASHRAIAGNGR